MDNANRVYNIFINSANRLIGESPYDFTILFNNDEIIAKENEGLHVNVVAFSMLNSMYNVNQYTANNTFLLNETLVTIPYGNYSVITLQAQLNALMSSIISVAYNTATNTLTYTNLTSSPYSITPGRCSKLLGLSKTTSLLTTGNSSTKSGYVNMVNYQQIILKCPSFTFENCVMDNITDKSNFISVSDILYWVNKQDVEPFKTINYKNEDCGTIYSYNITNNALTSLCLKLVNEKNEPIYDAPDYLLQLQISLYDKDTNFYKETLKQIQHLLNDIYFAVLNIFSIFGEKNI